MSRGGAREFVHSLKTGRESESHCPVHSLIVVTWGQREFISTEHLSWQIHSSFIEDGCCLESAMYFCNMWVFSVQLELVWHVLELMWQKLKLGPWVLCMYVHQSIIDFLFGGARVLDFLNLKQFSVLVSSRVVQKSGRCFIWCFAFWKQLKGSVSLSLQVRGRLTETIWEHFGKSSKS